MLRTFRSRIPSSSLALALAGILFAPLGIASASPARFADPAIPDWNVASGYGSVEANRAEVTSLFPASPVDPPAQVNPLRVAAALDALRDGDLGGMQEEALHAIVDSAVSWDVTSGYGAVESNRSNPGIVVLP